MDGNSGGLNWAALLPLSIGGILLLVAWEGTHAKLWSAITGKTVSDTSLNTPGAPFNPLTPNIVGSSACQAGTPGCPYTNTGTDYKSIASQDALAAGINPTYFINQIQAESGFNPNAQSPAGAQGIAQFMPATAKGMGVNPFDPIASLKAAAQLMGAYIQKYGGGLQSEEKALAAYNWGSGNLESDIATHGSSWLMYAPSETQNYINTIVGSSAYPPHVS